MPDVVREITVRGRPGFLGDGDWVLQNLTQINVLFGKNGAGKSQLLRLLMTQFTESSHYVSPERAGSDFNVEINMAADQLVPNTRNRSRQANFSERFRREAFTRVQSIMLRLGYETAARGKYKTPVELSEIKALVRELLPDLELEIAPGADPPISLFRLGDHGTAVQPGHLSSGETEAVVVALDMLSVAALWAIEGTSTRFLLVDEPDLHMHPDLQQRLAGFMVKVARRFDAQLIIATHSTTLLAAFGHHGGEMTSVIYLDNSKEHQRARRLNEIDRELSMLLGGHALMGPLFGAPLLLVEGDDDFQVWSQVPRAPKSKNRFAVFPCDGSTIERYSRSLDQMFSTLLETDAGYVAYVLRDGDVSLPQDTIHIKSLQLSCRETENLYLTDEVLDDLDLDWDTAVARLEKAAVKYPEREKTLRGIAGLNRKQADIKALMPFLQSELGEDREPWQLRVGRTIAKAKPDGQLADFLGATIVEAFWGSE